MSAFGERVDLPPQGTVRGRAPTPRHWSTSGQSLHVTRLSDAVIDLAEQNASSSPMGEPSEEVDSRIAAVRNHGRYILGLEVEELETTSLPTSA